MEPSRSAGAPSHSLRRETITIIRLGADGDGIGQWPDGTSAYAPFALPGETILAHHDRKRGQGTTAIIESVANPSPHRIVPVCRHFTKCGGCALQHCAAEPAAAWKAALLEGALRRAGFSDIPLHPIETTPSHTRRRLDFAIRRDGKKLQLGLHQAHDRKIIDLDECPVLHPTLAALVAPLRAMFASLSVPRREGAVLINLLDAGPDLLLRADAPPSIADRMALTAFARAHHLPRISWSTGKETPETIASLRPTTTSLAGFSIAPPPGAFLQASREGEAAITRAVLAGLPDKLPARAFIAELYSGLGTITFALARHGRVTAWEGDRAAVAALRAAAQGAVLGNRISITQQDLIRRPVLAKEFSGAAAIVLDPPFEGASVQMREIAAAGAPRVIYISCNPAALAHDAAMLHAVGYRIHAATPVDQFRWSARLESVTVFALEQDRRGKMVGVRRVQE